MSTLLFWIKILLIIAILLIISIYTYGYHRLYESERNQRMTSHLIDANYLNEIDFVKHYGYVKGIINTDLSDNMDNINKQIQLNEIRYIYINSYKSELSFCLNIATGTGNILSQYWAARAIAFYLGYDFKMISNLTSDHDCPGFIEKYWKNNHVVVKKLNTVFYNNDTFSSYLPKYVKYTRDNIKIHEIINMHHWIYHIIQNEHQYCLNYPPECGLFFTFYNPHYVSNFVIKETNDAMNEYLTAQAHAHATTDSINNDIVIHFRCSEIINLKWENEQYGFHTINYYKLIMQFLNAKNNELDKNSKIYIISQLKQDDVYSPWIRGESNFEKCGKLLHGIIESDEFLKIFDPIPAKNIIVIANGTLNDDFYKMLTAKILICSPSTFCLHAGIANKYGYIMIGTHGPWIDLQEIIKQKSMINVKESNKDLTVVNTKLMPKKAFSH